MCGSTYTGLNDQPRLLIEATKRHEESESTMGCKGCQQAGQEQPATSCLDEMSQRLRIEELVPIDRDSRQGSDYEDDLHS